MWQKEEVFVNVIFNSRKATSCHHSVVLKLKLESESPGECISTDLGTPTLVSNSVDLGCDPRMYFSNKFPGILMLLVMGITLETQV